MTNRFAFSSVKRNSFVQVSCGGEEGGSLCVAKVLLLFKIGVRGSNEN